MSAFCQYMYAIGLQPGPGLLEAIRPTHDNAVDGVRASQPEMEAQVVLRIVAAAAADFLTLLAVGRDEAHQRTDCAPVGLGADKLQRHPVPLAGLIEAEQIRCVVQIVDDDVDVAVVVEVGKRGPPAGLRRRHRRAELLADVREPSVAQVAVDDLALFVAGLGLDLANLGIDVTVDEKQIEPAVAVEIDETDAQPEPARVEPEAGRERAVLAEPLPVFA